MSRAAGFLDLLLPLRCLGCGGPAGRGRGRPVCPACATRIRPLPEPTCPTCGTPRIDASDPACDFCAEWPPEVRARSVTAWRDPADRIVEALKYDGWPEVGPWLGSRMARAVSPVPASTRVVPVPSTPGRLRERGFNPAARIAEGVASTLGIECVRALVRPAESPRQVGLPPDRRSANVRGVFHPAAGASAALGDRPIILVDDVLTTGATTVEAARTLIAAGARSVRILTFARSFPRRPGDARRAS